MKPLDLRFVLSLTLAITATVPLFAAEAPDARFRRLLDDAWEFSMREFPTFATRAGDNRYNGRLASNTIADHQRRAKANRAFLARLEAIDREKLSAIDQVNHAVFGQQIRTNITEYEFDAHLMPITNRSGFHIYFPALRRIVPLDSVKDYENYIARLNAFDRYAAQNIDLMRAGMKKGLVLPAVVLEGYRKPVTTHIVDDPTKSLLHEPFTKFPDAINQADRKRLAESGRRAISEGVVPGYRRFLKFMQDEYVPAARGPIGASAMPRGRAFYRHRVKRFTTLDLTPQQVHDTGLAEVGRIRAEMLTIIKKVGFKGDMAAFVKHLRTDPKFYAKTPKQLLKETAYVLKEMDGKLPKLFGKLPRTPYGIREVPSYIAPQTTTAYYESPTGGGRTAGFYYVNTYKLDSRPLYGVEALSLHEAVPGHHLQLALQQELEGLPKFRRYASFTVYIEGWALYAERLGLEVGFYQDPYSDYGRLTYEMWRACRLVVDTGMHYFGWTRGQAIDFMAQNTALSIHNITAEVDRYISWPGQALAYKIGELKIRQLRAMAEKRLGKRFDIRTFHDVVLGSGSVPLTVLEDNVKAYVERTAK